MLEANTKTSIITDEIQENVKKGLKDWKEKVKPLSYSRSKTGKNVQNQSCPTNWILFREQ